MNNYPYITKPQYFWGMDILSAKAKQIARAQMNPLQLCCGIKRAFLDQKIIKRVIK